MHQLLSATSADRYVEAMRETVDRLAGRLRDTPQPFSGASRAQLQELVDAVDLDADGLGTRSALREADDLVGEHAVWFHHPAYAAHLNCPVAVPAVVAEAIIAAVNPSLDTYDQSTIGTLMERKLVDWTCGRIGFAAGDGVFTSGGTQSNLQALLLARERRSRPVAAGQPRRRRAPARHRRHGVEPLQRAEGRAPAGARRRRGPARADRRARPDGPGGAGRAPSTRSRRSTGWPMCVVATAGTTDRGCLDPLALIADECDARGVWLHVDAAYGCGLLVSPTRRHLLDGIERARSVTVDFHKSFFQPVSSSAVLVPGRTDLRARHLARGLPQPRGRRGAQPGGQVAADDPPVRRAQAVDHAARAGRRRHRRDVRRRPRPGRAGARRDRPRRGPRAGRSHRAQHRPVPRTSRSTSRTRRPTAWCRWCAACCSSRAARPSPRPSWTGGRASSSRCSTPRRPSTTCARCSTWSAARRRRWSRATTWSTAAEVGAVTR